MPAIAFLFAGRFDRLRTGTPRSYTRLTHLIAGTKNFCSGTRMARSYKMLNCVFEDIHFALCPCAAATNSSLSIIASASGSAQPSSRQMSRPSLQAPKRFTRSASS